MSKQQNNWSYAESFIWGNNYPKCNGIEQSPINIDTDLTKECRTLCTMIPRFKPSLCFLNFKNRHITIKYDTGSYTEYKGVLYELKEITIHTPSLHSIDGEKHDLEVCLIHKLTDNSSDNVGLILCRMFERGPHYGDSENFINQIINNIPTEDIDYDKQIRVSKDWSAKMLIPKKSGYFSYSGSLPFPPCIEGYTIFVYEINIETLKRYLDNNIRSIKTLGDRTVFYTPFLESKNSERTVYKSKNKYLKCYRSGILNRPTDPTNAIKTSSKVYNGSGLKEKTKNYLKQILLSIIVLLIILNALLFTKYLFRHFFVQKILRLFGGKNSITDKVMAGWKTCKGSTVGDNLLDKYKPTSRNRFSDRYGSTTLGKY